MLGTRRCARGREQTRIWVEGPPWAKTWWSERGRCVASPVLSLSGRVCPASSPDLLAVTHRRLGGPVQKTLGRYVLLSGPPSAPRRSGQELMWACGEWGPHLERKVVRAGFLESPAQGLLPWSYKTVSCPCTWVLSIRCAWCVPRPHIPSRTDQHSQGPKRLACTHCPLVAAHYPLPCPAFSQRGPPSATSAFCPLPPPGTKTALGILATAKPAQVTAGLDHQVLGLKRPNRVERLILQMGEMRPKRARLWPGAT